ncbi:hypothetical protein ACFFKH_26590 [Micromonospora marina]|uniref:Uncharacterized protein n=1 Tax=Micromonospora marina TaxID=307120 RepID=A0A1C5ADT0_9ACTN|nr:hypothetical protein [Micromonospora marina]SCF43388.1 hypothetical protein GA0070215_12823 [Micromonospora marina]
MSRTPNGLTDYSPDGHQARADLAAHALRRIEALPATPLHAHVGARQAAIPAALDGYARSLLLAAARGHLPAFPGDRRVFHHRALELGSLGLGQLTSALAAYPASSAGSSSGSATQAE